MESSVIERFWDKVAVAEPDECWLWTAGKNGKGYGFFWFDGRGVAAHRFSYELTFGPVPEGLVIRHKECDNPPCVNPRHLMPGTVKQNKDDETGKMRHLFGERHHFTPLSEADVIAMRAEHVEGARPFELAARYRISKQAVIKILKGESWRCVTHAVNVYVPYRKQEFEARRELVAQLRPTHTQQEVADRLGITQAAVSYLERRQPC